MSTEKCKICSAEMKPWNYIQDFVVNVCTAACYKNNPNLIRFKQRQEERLKRERLEAKCQTN